LNRGRIALALGVLASAGCAAKGPDSATRMARLKASYDHLHDRLEKAAATEPLVSSAFATRGQVVVAIRSGLIEELAGNVARRYLDHVKVDLSGFETEKDGEIEQKTFLGKLSLGEWRVAVDLGGLVGDLRAGSPRVGLRAPDLIDIELPVDVRQTEGAATLRFSWDSSGLAKLVCKDFELTRDIHGRVLPQRHVLAGALRLANDGENLTATPEFPDRHVQLKLDLTDASWATVEEALRSQNTSGKCGMLMKPDKGVALLKDLAARGISVSLPKKMFRTVTLPARMHESVKVNKRRVRVALTAQKLRIDGATLWSSVALHVQPTAGPAIVAREPDREARKR